MRVMLTERTRHIIVPSEPKEDKDLHDITEEAGFVKIRYEELENPHAMPKINLDRLYTSGGEVYEFYGWEAPSGYMDTATGNVLMDKIGYFII